MGHWKTTWKWTRKDGRPVRGKLLKRVWIWDSPEEEQRVRAEVVEERREEKDRLEAVERIVVSVDRDGRVVEGEEFCFHSKPQAWRASHGSASGPLRVGVGRYGKSLYLAVRRVFRVAGFTVKEVHLGRRGVPVRLDYSGFSTLEARMRHDFRARAEQDRAAWSQGELT